MRLTHLATAFIALTIVVIAILDIVIPPLIRENPATAFYALVLILAIYSALAVALGRLSKNV